MPILAKEPVIFPEELLDLSYVPESKAKWSVLATKPRQEKALARELLKDQIPFYLPLVGKWLRIRGKRVQSFHPLFTSYIFFYGTDEQRTVVLKTNRVLNTLTVVDQEELVRDLRQIQFLINSDAPLTVEARLVPGQKVRVKTGAFMGFEGSVIRRKGKTCLFVGVHFLNRWISVEVNDDDLEPIG